MLIDLNPDLVKPRRPETIESENHTPNELLSMLRKLSRMSQQEVAEVMGVERTSVTNMEAGRQMVHIKYLDKLAEHLGLEMVITFKPKAHPHD